MSTDLTTRRLDDSVHRLTENNHKKGSGGAGGQRRSSSTQGDSGQSLVGCSGCGRRHAAGRCSASQIVCYTCGQVGHYAKRCPNGQHSRSESRHPANAPSTGFKEPPARRGTHMQLNSVEGEIGDGINTRSLEEYVLHELHHERRVAPGDSEWSENLMVDGVTVKVKLDSGASCNVMPQELFQRLPVKRRRLRPGPRLRRYGATNGYLSVLGVHTAKVDVHGTVYVVDFVVVDEPGQPTILGLPSCQQLDLIRRVHAVNVEPAPSIPPIVKEFMEVFTGLGKLPVEHTIKLATGSNYVDPVVSAAGRIPFRLEDPVYRKLDQMEAEGIIVPVTEPTEWVSRMLVASKPDGDIRICLDPSELNKAIQRQHFAVPTVEQLFAKIGKAKFFCSLDAASGFYQIPLSTESSFLCTMATPRGRYRFLRLPFGLKSAPEVYLQTMSELFGDLKGVIIYFDDFLVTGETREELDDNLRKVLERCRLHNLKLQLKKCKFFMKELPWLGHIIGEGVIKVDPAKVEAIVNMPEPSGKADLVRLLGMATYLDKFCENLAAITRPLRDLLKESSAWVWEEPQREAMARLKEAMSSLPTLRRFDLQLPVVLSVDASPTGIGAVLLQNGQPVAYSSTSLTPTQRRYCQIEKELLAVQFGLMRFRQYVYGQQATVESDHKPLVGLLDKPVAECTPRIQRMRMQLQRFDFWIVYKPGRELFIADALSRAHLPAQFDDDVTQRCQEQIHALLDQIIPLRDTRSKYVQATEDDPSLVIVKELMVSGWPKKKTHCPLPAKPYWNVRHALSEVDGLVLYGERLVVPVSLRREAMDGIHYGHFGEVKCIRRAKSSVYWPGCDDHIRNLVASCNTCQENRHKNPALLMLPSRIPVHPFQLVSADIFQFAGVHYLLLVDGYSKWPCVAKLRSLTSAATIEAMDGFFADFGTPEELLSDNGPQFASVEFNRFCASRGVRHVTSSPEFPQSNGLAERHIQTVKATMLKMFHDGCSLWEVLAAVRSTPVSDQLPSPSVLLQSRHLRGSLPFLPGALVPRVIPAPFVQRQLSRRQGDAFFHNVRRFDVRSSLLFVSQQVRTLIESRWHLGATVAVCAEPNSYLIRLVDGRLFRRTRWAINVVNGSPPTVPMQSPQQSSQCPSFLSSSMAVASQPVRVALESVSQPVSSQTSARSARPVDEARLLRPESRSPVASPLASAGGLAGADLIHPAVPVGPVGAVSPGGCMVPVRRTQPMPLFTRSGRQFSRPVPDETGE